MACGARPDLCADLHLVAPTSAPDRHGDSAGQHGWVAASRESMAAVTAAARGVPPWHMAVLALGAVLVGFAARPLAKGVLHGLVGGEGASHRPCVPGKVELV